MTSTDRLRVLSLHALVVAGSSRNSRAGAAAAQQTKKRKHSLAAFFSQGTRPSRASEIASQPRGDGEG